MRITIIGTGYVGLVSGVCFSEFGFDMTCVDKDVNKIAMLERGEVPIYEPGLDTLIANNRKAGRLHFTTDLAAAVSEADIVMIAVGTPPNPVDGHADMKYVFGAVKEVAQAMKGYTLIVTKSTVPAGTGAKVHEIVAANAPAGTEFDIASNPEFLREGSAIEDFMQPDRVIVGVNSDRAREYLEALYRPLGKEVPLVVTDIPTAELTKYAANSFLATKISFINEVAVMCEKLGANVQHLAHGMGLDDRIGAKFLQPGPGFGGSCFPKDMLALSKTAEQLGVPAKVIESVIAVNDATKLRMVEKTKKALGGSLIGKTLAVLGLTFKQNTDDMRSAASLVIVPKLIQEGATVRVYDPQGMKEAKNHYFKEHQGIVWCEGSYDACKGADAVVILTEWNEFRALDFAKMADLLTAPVMVDLRNLYRLDEIRKTGFHYTSIGRPEIHPQPAAAKAKTA